MFKNITTDFWRFNDRERKNEVKNAILIEIHIRQIEVEG